MRGALRSWLFPESETPGQCMAFPRTRAPNQKVEIKKKLDVSCFRNVLYFVEQDTGTLSCDQRMAYIDLISQKEKSWFLPSETLHSEISIFISYDLGFASVL